MGAMENWDMDDFYDEISRQKKVEKLVDYLAQYLEENNYDFYKPHRFEGGCAACCEGFYPQAGTMVFYVPVNPGNKDYSATLLGSMVAAAGDPSDYTPYHKTIYLFDGGKGEGARRFLESQGLLTSPFEILALSPTKSLEMEKVAVSKMLTVSGSKDPISCSQKLLGKVMGCCGEGMEFEVLTKESFPVSERFAALCEGVPCAYAQVGIRDCADEEEQIQLFTELISNLRTEEDPAYYCFLTEGKTRYCLGCTKGVATILIVGALRSSSYQLYENMLSEEDFEKVFQAVVENKLPQARELLRECLPAQAVSGKGKLLGPMSLADYVDDIWVDEIHWVRDMIPNKEEGAFEVRRNQGNI